MSFFARPVASPRLLALVLALLSPVSLLRATAAPRTAQVPVEVLELHNGMRFLLVERPEAPLVAAGWMVTAGSADDGDDRRGTAHLIEHLMFKGTRTIGTVDFEQESRVLAEQDHLWDRFRDLEAKAATASPEQQRKLERRLGGLREQLQEVQQRASTLARLGELSLLYSKQGATGLNAQTFRDLTLYFVTMPSERLEAWFWLESDRLREPVLREYYKEIQVLREERRMRIEATPTGSLDEALRARFWGDHPYSWDPQGDPEDLERLRRGDVREFFERHYRPDKLTVALVGRFDREQVEAWARLYFGRLSAPPSPEAAAIEASVPLRASEDRMTATCACPAQAQVLYPSAPFGDPDADVLQVLSAVMNGRSGRLYRSFVVEQQIAFSAYTSQISWRRTGEFGFRAESKGGFDPDHLVTAWDRELQRLQTEPVSETELNRARNRLIADGFRALKDPLALMKQLLIYEGLGDWQYLNRWSAQVLAVTSEDLTRAAARYLTPARRTVAVYRRDASAIGSRGRDARSASEPAT